MKDNVKIILYIAMLFVAIAIVGYVIGIVNPAYKLDYWNYHLAIIPVFPIWFYCMRFI